MTNDKLEKEMRKEEINDVYEEGEIYAQIALSGERIQESKVWIDKIVFAHKSKNIHTKEQYEKLRQK